MCRASVTAAGWCRRPTVGAVGEMPPGRDDQIGQIFRNMRSAMKVSRETIARRLATSPSTIDNFEAGAIAALPHWKETTRIIRGYCELLRMDPEPILWRIGDQLRAPAGPANPRVSAPPPAAAGGPLRILGDHGPEAGLRRARPSRRRRTVRTLFALSAPIAVVAGVALLAQVVPGPVYRGVGLLPGFIESPARAGLDYVMLLTAPRREGLKWIEVGDPRVRKADKLQTSTR